MAGGTILDNIITAISKSHKVILVVSERFLNSGWCKEELFMAHQVKIPE